MLHATDSPPRESSLWLLEGCDVLLCMTGIWPVTFIQIRIALGCNLASLAGRCPITPEYPLVLGPSLDFARSYVAGTLVRGSKYGNRAGYLLRLVHVVSAADVGMRAS